ncbi:MAG: hypothetical protein QRY72_03625 [Candidatus Rhabdochlamydia sp.]
MSVVINELYYIGNEETVQRKKWYQQPKRLAGTIISTVAAIACGVFQLIGRKYPIVTTLSSIGMGASLQSTLEIALPQSRLKTVHHVEMKNAFALYFVLTQIYLNLPYGSVEREVMLSLISTLGGAWIALKIKAIVSRKLGDQSYETPLLTESSPKKICFEPDSKAAFISYQIGKGALGGAMIGISQGGGYDYLSTLYNLGIFLIGHSAGVSVQVGLSHLKHQIRLQHQKETIEETTPLSLRLLNITERIIDTFGNHGWGMMMSVNHPAAYGSIGGLIGFTKMVAKGRFTTERVKNYETEPMLYKIDRIIDGILGVAVAGWVTAILIDDTDLFDRIAIASMGGTVMLGYGLRSFLNQTRRTESTWKNFLDFYTKEHSVVWIFPFAYVWQQLQINDIALAAMPTPAMVLAAIGWGSLGSSFGIDRALIESKISPIVDSLYGTLFIAMAKGQA